MTTSRMQEFLRSTLAQGWRRGRAHKPGAWKIVAVFLLCAATVFAVNPVPFVNQPLVPGAAAPGGPGFTLTVNGTGFVSSSIVLWNGSPRATQFVNQGQLAASIPATDIADVGTAWVTVVSPGPGGGASSTLFFPASEPSSLVSFSRTDYSSPGGNIQVVTADFNGDGKLDLAVSTYDDSTLRIFLGNGDGTFSVGPTYAVCNSHGLAIGDFNGDGFVDLAVADAGCGQVTILLGNGDGTFKLGGNFSTGGGGMFAPYSLVVADFNGDGKLDLATADELVNRVSVLLGNGDGTFQPHADYELPGQTIYHLAAGDFNGDGRLDLAVASAEVGVTILLGNGDGTFRQGSVIQLEATDNRMPATADLNGDGKLDLVIINSHLDTIQIMLGNGDGTFRSDGQYTSPLSDIVAIADLNADGVPDLAVTTYWFSSSVALLLGNGDGTFQAPIDFGAGDGARGVVAGDFNGDGRLDLAIANQFSDTISILLNQPSAAVTFKPSSLTFPAQAVGTFSPAQTVTLTNTSGETLTFSEIYWAAGDFYQSNNCPHRLSPQAYCTLSVMFTPTMPGPRAGAVKVADNAEGSPQKLPLTGTASGTGKIVLTLSPAALDFGDVVVGTSSGSQTVTVTNAGTVAASFQHPFGFNTAGQDCADFKINSQCGTSLAPNASCQVAVTFEPKASGLRSTNFVTLQGAHSVHIPLTGSGTL